MSNTIRLVPGPRSAASAKTLHIDPEPGTEGRWQPTRAGAVNSWQWADEQFLMCDGWLALVGPNGSGKSLAGTMFFPTLIDGDVSQKALSVQGHAAGTLSDRHTNQKKAGPPKTGLWWQEFGRTEPAGADGQGTATTWWTVGLWLRSSGSSLDRAWFLAPARVDIGLHLVQDRTAVGIEELARQLAACDGSLFTSVEDLSRSATKHLAAVAGESAYPHEVRAAMFSPFGADEYTALASVLRALRGIRVGEKVSPDLMHTTLTSALPALDAQRIQRLADALAKTQQLEHRLDRARGEREALTDIATAYRRYAGAIAGRASAQLLHDHHQHARLAGERTAMVKDKEASKQARGTAETNAKRLAGEIGDLAQSVEKLQRRHDGHAGAALPELQQRIEQLEEAASHATEEADNAQQAAEEARQVDEEHRGTALGSAEHMRSMLAGLEPAAEALGASAFHAGAAAAAAGIGDGTELPDAARYLRGVSTALDAFRAWGKRRAGTLSAIETALFDLKTAQANRDSAAGLRDQTQNTADTAITAAEGADRACQQADATLAIELAAWARTLRRMPAMPEELRSSEPLDLQAITGWTAAALAKTLADWDLPAATAKAAATAQAAAAAHNSARAAAQDADEQLALATAAAAALSSLTAKLPGAPPALGELAAAVGAIRHTLPDEASAPQAHIGELAAAARAGIGERRAALADATAAVAEHVRQDNQAREHAKTLTEAEQREKLARIDAELADIAAQACATAWIESVRSWAAGLHVLEPTRIGLPEPTQAVESLPAFRAAVSEEHRRAVAEWSATLAGADILISGLVQKSEELIAETAECQHAAPAPPAPPWRPDRGSRGGAPLWATVDFAPGLDLDRAAQLEGALLAAGLLDAWISPDGELTAGDIHLIAGQPVGGTTLADLLTPEPSSPVPADTIQAVLACIGITEHREPDIAALASLDADGSLRLGPIHASSPPEWQVQYIGLPARERSRKRQLAILTERQRLLDEELRQARRKAKHAEEQLQQASREAEHPMADDMLRQHHAAATLDGDIDRHAQWTAHARSAAQASTELALTALHGAEQACKAAGTAVDAAALDTATLACSDLFAPVERADATGQRSTATRAAAHTAAGLAADLAERAAEDALSAQAAREAVEDAQAEHASCPSTTPCHQMRADRDQLDLEAQAAEGIAERAAKELKQCEQKAATALAALNLAARTEDGRVLPTEANRLTDHRQAVNGMLDDVADWARAAERAHTLSSEGRRLTKTASDSGATAHRLAARAEELNVKASFDRRGYEEEVRIYGVDFAKLVTELKQGKGDLSDLQTQLTNENDATRDAELRLAGLQARLEDLDKRHVEALGSRDRSAAAVQGLFDHHLIADVVDAESLQRPDHPEAAIQVATHIAAGRNLQGPDPVATAEAAVSRTLSALDTQIRNRRDSLTRLGRHIEHEEVPGAGWRRVVVAEQGEASTDLTAAGTQFKPLRAALEDLTRSIETLERDFNDQVRAEVKGTLFTDLRKHINVRIALAGQIVADIMHHLKDIRTGAARVGVSLAWNKREDPGALRAISLIQSPTLEGAADEMYDFFIARLMADGPGAGPWADRVQRVFDYRDWYEWEIKLTHADFSDTGDGREVFKKITPRNNPMDKLSTGEKRLATMLPLLAAAKAFYSTAGYSGPRTVFIDELDAAFDPNNLRIIIGLLREWDFDLITTLPTMTPLLKPEARSVAIHRIDAARHGIRISIPCVWKGSGRPSAVRISVGTTLEADSPPQAVTPQPDGQQPLFADTHGE